MDAAGRGGENHGPFGRKNFSIQDGHWRYGPRPGCQPGPSLPLPGTSQCYEVTLAAGADGRLEVAGGYQVDLGAEDGLQVGLDPSQAEQAHLRRQVHEQVDVAIGPVLAASDAAEDPQVSHVVGGGRSDQVPPFPPDLPPYRAGQPAQLRRLRLDIHYEIAASRINQPGQRREGRLPPSGLISADHALRDARPEGQLCLRYSRIVPGPPQQAPGRFVRAIHEANYSGL